MLGRDEIIHELRRVEGTEVTIFALVDDTAQWPHRSSGAGRQSTDVADPDGSPLRGPVQAPTGSATDGPPPSTSLSSQKTIADGDSALRTQEALDMLVGKDAVRFKNDILQPENRLVKAGVLNKMGGKLLRVVCANRCYVYIVSRVPCDHACRCTAAVATLFSIRVSTALHQASQSIDGIKAEEAWRWYRGKWTVAYIRSSSY